MLEVEVKNIKSRYINLDKLILMKKLNKYILEKFKISTKTISLQKDYYIIPWWGESFLNEKYIVAHNQFEYPTIFLLSMEELYYSFIEEYGKIRKVPDSSFCFPLQKEYNKIVPDLRKENNENHYNFEDMVGDKARIKDIMEIYVKTENF